MQNNPITIIKEDHKVVEGLFKEYEALGEDAVAHRRTIADKIIRELTTHAEMEESLCYPRFREAFNSEDDPLVAEAYAEHEGAKKLLADLETIDTEDDEFDEKMKALMEKIRHHVEEEEGVLLPKAEEELPEIELETMGDEMRTFKETQKSLLG